MRARYDTVLHYVYSTLITVSLVDFNWSHCTKRYYCNWLVGYRRYGHIYSSLLLVYYFPYHVQHNSYL